MFPVACITVSSKDKEHRVSLLYRSLTLLLEAKFLYNHIVRPSPGRFTDLTVARYFVLDIKENWRLEGR